jgi:hypothetical protein
VEGGGKVDKEYISASEAHKYLLINGFDFSYPTAIAWLKAVEGLTSQPTGYRSTILVDKALLEKAVAKAMRRKSRA